MGFPHTASHNLPDAAVLYICIIGSFFLSFYLYHLDCPLSQSCTKPGKARLERKGKEKKRKRTAAKLNGKEAEEKKST